MLWLQQAAVGTVPRAGNNSSGERLQHQVLLPQTVQLNGKIFGEENKNNFKPNLVHNLRTNCLNIK